jgi:hypothetical protein
MSKDKYMTFDMLFYFSHCTKTYHLNHLWTTPSAKSL